MANAPGLSSYKQAVIVDEYKFIYVEIAKAACSSIKRSLGKAIGASPETINGWANGKLPTVNLSDGKYSDYFKFTFVRNPWDRAVSCYENKFNHPDPKSRQKEIFEKPLAQLLNVKKVTFNDFLSYISSQPDEISGKHFRSQYFSIFDEKGNNMLDFIGQLETINMDFKEVCTIIGINADLMHMLQSRHRRGLYQVYYNAASQAIVNKRYKLDIELFQYQF